MVLTRAVFFFELIGLQLSVVCLHISSISYGFGDKLNQNFIGHKLCMNNQVIDTGSDESLVLFLPHNERLCVYIIKLLCYIAVKL